jgi:hypothetical protein
MTRAIVCGAILLGLVVAWAALDFGSPAEAQLDPGNFELYQNGVKVGEVFVPVRDRNARNYSEHWVLFAAYVDPAEGRGSTEIRPVAPRYQTLPDFFRRVPFEDGSRYVLIGAHESDHLPGRPRPPR